MFPKANIAASPLVNSIHVQGQVMAIYSGANVLRVPLFPPPVPGVTRRSGGVSLLRRLQSLYASLSSHNYEMVVDRGDSLRFLNAILKHLLKKTNWTSFQWSQPVFDCSKTGSFYKQRFLSLTIPKLQPKTLFTIQIIFSLLLLF